MKTILALLMSVVGAVAQADYSTLLLLTPPVAAGATYLIEEGFEEADGAGSIPSATDGYDSALAFAETGTPNNDYATSPAPLVGSYSLFLDSSGGAAQAVRWDLSSSENDLWVYFKFSDASLPANSSQPILELTTSAGTTMGFLYLRTDGNFRIYNGTSATDVTVGTVSASTTYHFWYHWKSDGTASFGFSTDGTRPTSGNNYVAVTGGDGTSAVTRIYLRASDLSLQTMIVDRLLVSTSTIGDNP